MEVIFGFKTSFISLKMAKINQGQNYFSPHPLTLCRPGSGKMLWMRGIMAPLVFQLWGYQKPKTKIWHIFGPKNNLKSHFGQFQVPQFSSLAAEGQKWYFPLRIVFLRFEEKLSKYNLLFSRVLRFLKRLPRFFLRLRPLPSPPPPPPSRQG